MVRVKGSKHLMAREVRSKSPAPPGWYSSISTARLNGRYDNEAGTMLVKEETMELALYAALDAANKSEQFNLDHGTG